MRQNFQGIQTDTNRNCVKRVPGNGSTTSNNNKENMIEEVALTLKGEDIPESKEQEEFLFVTEEKLNSIETNKVKEQNRKKQKHASSWKRHSEGIDLSGIDTRSESF